MLARIIHAVEAAQGNRAPTQRFVDQFARWYTPLVFVAVIAAALVPPLFMGAAWLDWIYRALVLLVVACPPIGIEHPTTIAVREDKNRMQRLPFTLMIAQPGQPLTDRVKRKRVCQRRDRLIETKAAGDADRDAAVWEVTPLRLDVRPKIA